MATGPATISEILNLPQRLTNPTPEQIRAVEERAIACERNQRANEQQLNRDAWNAYCASRGKRYADCSFDNFDVSCEAQQKAVNALKEYAEDISQNIRDGVSVILYGQCGNGKDHLMQSLCRDVFRSGRRVVWSNGVTIHSRMRDRIGTDRTESEVLREWQNADVFYLSDPIPAREELTAAQVNTLYQIIDHRYNNMLPTWLTINVATAAEFEKLSRQVAGRLKDGALAIFCDWSDHRKANHPAPKNSR